MRDPECPKLPPWVSNEISPVPQKRNAQCLKANVAASGKSCGPKHLRKRDTVRAIQREIVMQSSAPGYTAQSFSAVWLGKQNAVHAKAPTKWGNVTQLLIGRVDGRQAATISKGNSDAENTDMRRRFLLRPTVRKPATARPTAPDYYY